MLRWENQLCFRATDRIARPFEYGIEWSRDWPFAQECMRDAESEEDFVLRLNRRAIEGREEFFHYEPPQEFSLEENWLTFQSPVATPYEENNAVRGLWFSANKPNGKAVVVLPHWNSKLPQQNALCAGLQRLGISALRLSLPYHDARMPAGLARADYAMSGHLQDNRCDPAGRDRYPRLLRLARDSRVSRSRTYWDQHWILLCVPGQRP